MFCQFAVSLVLSEHPQNRSDGNRVILAINYVSSIHLFNITLSVLVVTLCLEQIQTQSTEACWQDMTALSSNRSRHTRRLCCKSRSPGEFQCCQMSLCQYTKQNACAVCIAVVECLSSLKGQDHRCNGLYVSGYLGVSYCPWSFVICF